MSSTSFFVVALLLSSFNSGWAKRKKECYVDDNGDKEDPNNIYTCKNEETCCHEGGKPSCCTKKDMKVAAVEQAKLWGTVAGLIVIIAILMFCWRNDGDFCWDRKDGGRYKYCCCGPVLYREGKGPDMKSDYHQFQNEEDYPYKHEKMDHSLRHPSESPPPYQRTEIENINETASHKENKNHKHDDENRKDDENTRNDHQEHENSHPPNNHDNHARTDENEDNQQIQNHSQQAVDDQNKQDHDKQNHKEDLMSFNDA